MKALTLHQPWASLIAHGVKTVETRSWAPPRQLVGQRIAIHAGRRVVRGGTSWGTRQAIADLYGPEWWKEIPVEAVVCTALLVEVRRVTEHSGGVAYLAPSLGSDRSQVQIDPHGDFDPGRWLWFLRDVELVEPPSPAIGHQGLWNWETPAVL